jgi:hypothetical protein
MIESVEGLVILSNFSLIRDFMQSVIVGIHAKRIVHKQIAPTNQSIIETFVPGAREKASDKHNRDIFAPTITTKRICIFLHPQSQRSEFVLKQKFIAANQGCDIK